MPLTNFLAWNIIGAVFVTVRLNSSWTYNVSVGCSALSRYNLTQSSVNNISPVVFTNIRAQANLVVLIDATLTSKELTIISYQRLQLVFVD